MLTVMNNKIILLFLLSGFLFAGTIRAQWSTEKCPTNNNLNAIAFTGQKMGWIVGDKGIILRRTNNQWSKWQDVTNENLHSICMVDEQTGWAVGDKGTILRFDGNTWRNFISPTKNNLFSVCFSDAEHGIAVGDYGTVLDFKDGVWNLVKSRSLARLLTVNVNSVDAWIGGWLECANVPLMKMNMNNRDKTSENVLDSYASINSISFSDQDNGWAVGSPVTLLHFDGQQWKKIFTGEKHSSLKSVFFNDVNSGISVGYGGTILIYKAGSWTKENLSSDKDLNGATISGDAYYAIGDSGTILTSKLLPEKLKSALLPKQSNLDFRLFPNPCNDILNITLLNSFTEKSVLISISNIWGQVLLQTELFENQTNTRIQFNTSNLQNGMYFLQILDGAAISKTGFVILH